MPVKGGAFFGFAIVIAVALITWGIIALVDEVENRDNDSNANDSGTDSSYERDSDDSVYQALLNNAEPGDVIEIPDGTYSISLTTAVDGTEDNPITIRAETSAEQDEVVLKGFSDRTRVIEIVHSWYIIEGFTVDGENSDDDDGYISNLIFVEGSTEPDDEDGVLTSITGIVIRNMILMNAGKECVRFKNWVTNSVIENNLIHDCGVKDFQIDSTSDSNGEGVYIGTASGQWESDDGDVCRGNVVQYNEIYTKGSEGVEIKEGSIENVIQENEIYDCLYDDGGCVSLRGNENIVRNNVIHDSGYCIRIGGNEVDDYTYGDNNEVYDNEMYDCEEAVVKVNTSPNTICENDYTTLGDDDYEVVAGDAADDYDDIDGECPDSLTTVVLPDYASGEDDDDDRDDDDGDDDATDVTVAATSGVTYAFLACADSEAESALTLSLEDEDSMDYEMCALECINSSDDYFGIHDGSECWCGTRDEYASVVLGQGNCNTTCPGDSDSLCGGTDSFTIFRIYYSDDDADDTDGSGDEAGSYGFDDSETTASGTVADDDTATDDTDDDDGDDDDLYPEVTGATYLGCYDDSDSDPLVGDEEDFAEDDALTPQMCIDACSEDNYGYAALQNGEQCWCDNELGDSDTDLESGNCTVECEGDSTQMCGGVNSVSVFELT